MDNDLEKLQKELEDFKKQAEEYLNGWKRSKADFINREKEIERERDGWIKFANLNFALALLPFVDSFHAALASMPKELGELEWASGFRQLANQLEEVLKTAGVEAVSSPTHQFNPEIHECVGTEKGEIKGVILKEVQKGFMLNGKILRPAKVIISE